MTTELTIRRPDDWHLHLRDGAMMAAVLPETARHFARAIAMPNLMPPVITKADAAAYRDRIRAALPQGMSFEPVMTLYLTEDTDPEDVAAAYTGGVASAVKLYPAGATTNSASGVRDFDKVRGVLEKMAEIGMPLSFHGEVVDDDVDIFDREAVFIDRILDPILRAVPGLRLIMEHLTTRYAVDYAWEQDENFATTITAHHLSITRNDMLAKGGIRPDFYCMPIVKTADDRAALRAAAISGDPRFFLGTDSAPHPVSAKHTGAGSAGCFSAPNALPIYAQVFDDEGALDKLEGFASLYGPRFYRLPVNEERVTLIKGDPVEYPAQLETDLGPVTVFNPGFPLYWRQA